MKKNKAVVCGGKYTIQRKSAEHFFEGVDGIGDYINSVMGELGWKLQDGSAIELLSCTEHAEIVSVIVRNITESRDDLYEIISFFSDIPTDDLKNDPDIGVGGLAEIIVAIIEAYGLDYFFVTALPVIRNAWQGIKNARGLTGAANTNL